MVGGAGGGGLLAGAETVMVKGESEARAMPSLTPITMLPDVPTLAAVGVPVNWPVVELKLAQDGLPEIENLSVVPRGPLALGVKAYAVPATSVRAGEPDMVGLIHQRVRA